MKWISPSSSPKSHFNDHFKAFCVQGNQTMMYCCICILHLFTSESHFRLQTVVEHFTALTFKHMEHQTQICMSDCSSTRTKRKNPQPPTPTWQRMEATSCQLIREVGDQCVTVWWHFTADSVQAPDTRQPPLVARGGKTREGGEWRGCWSEITGEEMIQHDDGGGAAGVDDITLIVL